MPRTIKRGRKGGKIRRMEAQAPPSSSGKPDTAYRSMHPPDMCFSQLSGGRGAEPSHFSILSPHRQHTPEVLALLAALSASRRRVNVARISAHELRMSHSVATPTVHGPDVPFILVTTYIFPPFPSRPPEKLQNGRKPPGGWFSLRREEAGETRTIKRVSADYEVCYSPVG